MNDQVAAVTAMLAETPDNLRVWLRELRDNRPARYRKLFAHCTRWKPTLFPTISLR
jgi:hypothetical protein